MSHEGYYGSDGGGRPAQQQQPPFGGPSDMTAGMQRISVPLQDAYMGDEDAPNAGGRGMPPTRRGSGSPGLSFGLNGDYGSSNSLHSSSSALDLSIASTFDIVKEARKVIRAFLLEHQCYELIKNSGKVCGCRGSYGDGALADRWCDSFFLLLRGWKMQLLGRGV